MRAPSVGGPASESEVDSGIEDDARADASDAGEDDSGAYAMIHASDAAGADNGMDAPPDPVMRIQVDASDWRTSVGPNGRLSLLPFQERNVSIDSGLFLVTRALQMLREHPEGPSPVVVGISGPRGSGVTSLASAISVLLDDAVVMSADSAPGSASAGLGLGEQASELLRAQRAYVRSELEVLRNPECRAGAGCLVPSAVIIEAPLEVLSDADIAEAVHLGVRISGGLNLHLRARVQDDAVAVGNLLVEGGTTPMNFLYESLLEDEVPTSPAGESTLALPHLHILNDFDEMARPIDPMYEAAVLVSDDGGSDRGGWLRLLEGPAPVVDAHEIAIALGALADAYGRTLEKLRVHRRSWQDFYVVPPGADTASALSDPSGRWMRVRREGVRMRMRMGTRPCPYAMWLRGASGELTSFREPRARPLGTPALCRPEYGVPMRTLAALLAAGYRIAGAATVTCTEYVFADGEKRSSLMIETVDGAGGRAHTEAFVRGPSAPEVGDATRALGQAVERVRDSAWAHLSSTWSAGVATAVGAVRAALSPISTVSSSLALGLDHSPATVAMEGVDKLEVELLEVARLYHGLDTARLQTSVLLANRRIIVANRRAVAAGGFCLAALLTLGVSAFTYRLLAWPRAGGGGGRPPPRHGRGRAAVRAELGGIAWPGGLARAPSSAIELGLWAIDAISGAVSNETMRCATPLYLAWRHR